MGRTEWQFTSPAPVKQLFAVSYTGQNPKAVLFFHHGINEHIGRYKECESPSNCSATCFNFNSGVLMRSPHEISWGDRISTHECAHDHSGSRIA